MVVLPAPQHLTRSLVFAFIGFEHLGNAAEEMKAPRRTLPLATAPCLDAILLLALAVPLTGLADLAARFTVMVLAIVNAAPLRIKWQEAAPPVTAFVCPRWVPAAGPVSGLGLLVPDQAVR